jgi:hypothetical protein
MVAAIRYGPIGKFGKTKSPFAPVTTVRVIAVPVCVTLTDAPGKTPPDSSATVPES